MTASSMNPARSNARSNTRKLPHSVTSTSNDSPKRAPPSNPGSGGLLSPPKPQTQSRLPEARTPIGLRRPNSLVNASPNRLTASSSQTPTMKLTREIKSRLPRVAPTPISQKGGSISSIDTRRLRVKKTSNQIPRPPNLILASSASTLTPSHLRPPSRSESNVLSESTATDPDKTPQKSRPEDPASRRSLEPSAARKVFRRPKSSKASEEQKNDITFPTIVEDLTPKRPMTRARSKHLLDLSTSTQESGSQPPSTGIPVPHITRKSSRVIEIAKAFQSQSSSGTIMDGLPVSSHQSRRKSSQNLLRATPDRRKSDASNSSLVSPSASMIGNSPNISALAASLSKQFVQRDRSYKGRPSMSDMLRYSTISTLGELHWEDEADEVLLTDPNETEAMVADISMTQVTPLKSEVQSAAIALASARANFLSIVQENDEQIFLAANGGGGRSPEMVMDLQSPSGHSGSLKKNTSASSLISIINNNGLSPLSRHNRIGSSSSQSPSSRTIAFEAQLATLSTSLEKSRQRETELQGEIKRLLLKEEKQVQQVDRRGTINREREKSLEEEIKRLENELEECKEVNIELENSLDLTKFENQENLKKIHNLSLINNHHHYGDPLALEEKHRYHHHLDNNQKDEKHPTRDVIDDDHSQRQGNLLSSIHHQQHRLTFQKFDQFDRELVDHLSFIKESLDLLALVKLSLAISHHLFSNTT